MFKSFSKLVITLASPSFFMAPSPLIAANFSVDNPQQQGIGSLAEVIKVSNAIYPGHEAYNVLFFRSNLVIDGIYPQIRQNVNFNVVDPYFVTLLSSLNSSAAFAKSGQGTLEIKAPFNFIKDIRILEGTLIKSSPDKIEGQYLVMGNLQSSSEYLGHNDIVLANGQLTLVSDAIIDNFIQVQDSGQIDTGAFDVSLKNLQGRGVFTKLGMGNLSLTEKTAFKGQYQINQGSLVFNQCAFSDSVLLNGGQFKIISSDNIQDIELILQKGTVSLETNKTVLLQPVIAQDADAVFELNQQALILKEGIKGEGLIEFNGPGILQMGANNPFSGDITLNKLQYTPTNFAKNTVYKLNDVTVDLQHISDTDPATTLAILPGKTTFLYQSDPISLKATIDGKGDIEAIGKQQITVTSSAPYQGQWTQSLGQLKLEGSLHDVLINEFASITGSGIADNLNIKGLILPSINSANTQKVLSAKNVTITGSLIINPEVGGVYKEGRYLILKTPLADISKTVFLAPAQFEGEVIQNQEGLSYVLNKFYLFSDYVDHNNLDDLAVAASLDSYYALAGTDKDNVLRKLLSLRNDQERFNQAFSGLQPAYFSALGLTQEYNFVLARSTLNNRMEELLLFSCAKDYIWDEPCAVWLDPVGDFTKQEPRQQDMGYHSATVGGFLGIDGKVGSYLRLGMLTGYTNSHVRWMEDVGKGIINSEYLAGYFIFKPNQFYLNGSFLGSYSHYNVARNIHIVDIHRQARHNNQGFGFEADIEFGYVFKGKTQLQPYLRQSYIGLYQEKFQEYGAQSLNLNVDSKKFAMYRIDAGFIFSRCLNYEKLAITPEISLSGIWEQELKTGIFQATYQDSLQSYQVIGMKPKRLLISPGAAIDFVIKKYPLMLGIRYHGEFSSQFTDQRISGHFGYGF